MKKLNPKHQIFIREMILHGNRIKAYTAAYPKSRSPRQGAYQLMQNQQIAGAIQSKQNIQLQDTSEYPLHVMKQAGEMQLKLLKEQLATLQGMRSLLAEIISGEIKTEKAYKIETSLERIELRASVSEILRSLNLNFKMIKAMTEGDFIHRFALNVNGTPFN